MLVLPSLIYSLLSSVTPAVWTTSEGLFDIVPITVIVVDFIDVSDSGMSWNLRAAFYILLLGTAIKQNKALSLT